MSNGKSCFESIVEATVYALAFAAMVALIVLMLAALFNRPDPYPDMCYVYGVAQISYQDLHKIVYTRKDGATVTRTSNEGRKTMEVVSGNGCPMNTDETPTPKGGE